MAYKLSSNCVGVEKLYKKHPIVPSQLYQAVRPKWFTRVTKAIWKFQAFKEEVLVSLGPTLIPDTSLRSAFLVCLVNHWCRGHGSVERSSHPFVQSWALRITSLINSKSLTHGLTLIKHYV